MYDTMSYDDVLAGIETMRPAEHIDGTTDDTVRQVRAARALLGWGQDMLAHKAGITPLTVSNFERKVGVPRMSTEESIMRALADAGIVFLRREDGCIGVALTNGM
jgi:DNA-binding XRE family transcriptional regulator